MTSSPSIQQITSRENPLVKDLRRLSQDSTAYRKQGRVWLEGDHLCRAALQRGLRPRLAVYAESFWQAHQVAWLDHAERHVVMPDALFRDLSGLESPAPLAFVLDLPQRQEVQPGRAAVVLDRVQDAGNVGSILRSAAAFGFEQVLALKGSAALWSPKVLRAGMGAHFGLSLLEGVLPQQVAELGLPLIVTSSHQGALIQHQALPWPCAWAMGHEGQGVGEALQAQASLSVRIGQPGGEESLNVAAAAAICLHASAIARG
ncbi:MAG: RNA methyltransferase [Curvibacter sp.]|nr:RNA methyltransferase [Curvibacter sp.]